MKPQTRKLALITLSASALLLAACSEEADNSTVGQKLDNAVEQSRQAMSDAGDTVKEAARDTESAARDLANTAEDSARQAGNTIERKLDAASAATDDGVITAQVKAKLVAADDLKALDINVDTQDGRVTLRGSAPSEAARDHAAVLARAVEGVESVDNQLKVN
jgi:osmotically-inducible protein OsmY